MNIKIVFQKTLLLLIIFFLFSCHPTQELMIQDKENYCKKYYKKIDNHFELTLDVNYTISGYLALRLSLINLSNYRLLYNTHNLNIESESFSINGRFSYVSLPDTIIRLNDEILQDYIIKPFKELKIESTIYLKDLSKGLEERWPWPKGEKVKLELGEIQLDDKIYPLGFVYITHESVIEKEKL